MRPTSDELLTGMRGILQDVILPELETPWAQAMGAHMVMICDHLIGRDEREHVHLHDQNERLAGSLRRMQSSLGQEPEADGLPDHHAASDIEELRRRNAALRQSLSEAIALAFAQRPDNDHHLPTRQAGIDDILLEAIEADAGFWRPIGMRPQLSSTSKGGDRTD